MTRYHPLLVILHWLLALLIIGALLTGNFILDPIPNDSPDKIGALRAHMIVGFVILALMLLRLTARIATTSPPAADAGNPMLNSAGKATHWVLYGLVLAMCLSGIATSFAAGLPAIVFGGNPDGMAISFAEIAPRIAHGMISKLLILLLIGHILAALYHQYYRRDRLFSRMWFGKRD